MKEDTKRLDKIEDLEEQNTNNEIVDTEENEITDELIETVDNDDEEIEESPKIVEKPSKKQKKSNKKNSKNNKKKKIIIITSIVIILIIVVVLIFVFLNKKDTKEELRDTKKSDFINAINKSLISGDLSKEVKKGLKDNSLETDKVYMISLDIDSDNKQELIAYAEDGNDKILLNFDVDEEISYEEAYQIDSKDSLGYTFSTNDNKAYWYTIYKDKYSIISDTIKIINKEDYDNAFYEITKTYDDEDILDNSVRYNLGKKLDLEELEDNQITNKKLLKDNKKTLNEIKDEATIFFEEKKKKEDEEKKKQEEEKKAKAEQELKAKKEAEEKAKAQEQASSELKVGTNSFKFGTYNITNPDGSSGGTLTINSDYTCIHLGASCTYKVDNNIDVSQDPSIPAHASGIVLSDGSKYIASLRSGEFTDTAGMKSVTYSG